MSKVKIINDSARASDTSFENFYNDISKDWQTKAQRLQQRRWRKLSHRAD